MNPLIVTRNQLILVFAEWDKGLNPKVNSPAMSPGRYAYRSKKIRSTEIDSTLTNYA